MENCTAFVLSSLFLALLSVSLSLSFSSQLWRQMNKEQKNSKWQLRESGPMRQIKNKSVEQLVDPPCPLYSLVLNKLLFPEPCYLYNNHNNYIIISTSFGAE